MKLNDLDDVTITTPATVVNGCARTVAIAAVISVCVNGLFIAAECHVVSPFGTDAVARLVLLLAVPLGFSLLSVPILALGLIFKRTRRGAAILCLSCLVFFFVGLSCVKVGRVIRMHAFRSLAVRSVPLVKAIKRFETEHGHAPRNLGELVPAYLSAVPQTGMGAYPDYEYAVRDINQMLFGEQWPNGNAWVLHVRAPFGGSFDMFLYFPKGNYPEHAYSSWLEPVDGWAYAHE